MSHTHTRHGVYAIALREGCILLTEKGPAGCYAGLFDLPGGGIEFGENAEMTLRREFLEEVGMTFEAMQHFDNLSVVLHVPASKMKVCGYKAPDPDLIIPFHHLGQIYFVESVKKADTPAQDVHKWHSLSSLKLEELTPFAKEVVKRIRSPIQK
jgi:8-oxo-dGTP diphosphatase